MINSSEGNSYDQLSTHNRTSIIKPPFELSRNTKLKEIFSSPDTRRMEKSPLIPIKRRLRPNLNINIDSVWHNYLLLSFYYEFWFSYNISANNNTKVYWFKFFTHYLSIFTFNSKFYRIYKLIIVDFRE